MLYLSSTDHQLTRRSTSPKRTNDLLQFSWGFLYKYNLTSLPTLVKQKRELMEGDSPIGESVGISIERKKSGIERERGQEYRLQRPNLS